MELDNRFGVTDYVVFALSLLISLGIGVYSAFTGRKQKTTDDFYFGSRDLNVVAVALSMAATFLSAIAILGFPSEMYYNGISMVLMLVTDLLTVLVAIFLFIPFFYNLGLTSVYEYFELRFSRLIRRMACVIFVANMELYIAIVLFAPSLALSQVSGLPLWVCILSTGLVCTIYTAVGGMKAVVWTDAFQMGVMFFGVLTILIIGYINSTGLATVWEDSRETGRLQISFDPNPTIRHTFWTLMIGGFFNALPAGVNQATVQRYFSVKSQRAAQKMYAINAPVVALWKMALFFIGLLMVSFYKGCDPALSGRIQRPDQISALYVLDTVSFIPGFAGLFTAIVCSATLSTVSSGVNSIVVVINEDFIKPALTAKNREGGGEKFFIRLSKGLTLLVGCITIGMAFGASMVGRLLVQFSLSVYGMCGGPLLGLFFCGMMLPYCNAKGAAAGLLSGLAVVFWIGTAALFTQTPKPPLPLSVASCLAPNSTLFNLTDHTTDTWTTTVSTCITGNCTSSCFEQPESFGFKTIYSISYQYYSVIGFTITIVIATLVSFITGRHIESSIPDQFLLYKMFNGTTKKDSPGGPRRPYAYTHVEGIDLAIFDRGFERGGSQTSQTKVMRKVSGKR